MKVINLLLFFIFLTNPVMCQDKQYKIDICDKKEALEKLDVVQKNAKEIISKANDNCVLEFLDTLTALFIDTRQRKYIQTLDSICQIADGYVGEDF